VGRTSASPTWRRRHWDDRYTATSSDELSWFQEQPAVSLGLIAAAGLDRTAALIDVGGGAARLVDHLLADGWSDLTVLDVSDVALNAARTQVGTNRRVEWIAQDLLTWEPTRRYDAWHDRAVFHFLVDEDDRRQYRAVLSKALTSHGTLMVGTFASDGPTHCSGLPVARYDSDALVSALGGRFDVLATEREEHVTPHGTTQPFTWVALRCL
jgi:trans-aconitate methyltransferase